MQILQVLDGADPFVRPLDGRTLVVGSAAECDLVLASAGVEKQHLRIEFEGREPWIEALGGRVLLNGRAVQRAALALGDRIEIGTAVVVLAASVARPAEPEDVLDAVPQRTRQKGSAAPSARPARSARRSGSGKALPLVLGTGLALGLLGFLLLQNNATTLPPVFAEFDRLRRAGSFEVAQGKLVEMERWATDDERRARVAAEAGKLQAMIERVQRRQQAILSQSSERTEAEFSDELKREERSAPDDDDRIAARIVRSSLYELLREAVAKTPPPPRETPANVSEQRTQPQPTKEPQPPKQDAPRTVPQPEVARTSTPAPQENLPATSRTADEQPRAVVSKDDVMAAIDGAVLQVSKGEFAQAQSTLQMAIAGSDASERARLEAELTRLRAAAKAQMDALLATARQDAEAGRLQSSIDALVAAERRLPSGAEFAAVPTMLAELRRAHAARGGGRDPDATLLAVDEAERRRTLATLAPALIKIRAAEDAGDFAVAAAELARAAESVRPSDADYATRLELRLADLQRVIALHDELATLVKSGAVVAFESVGNGSVQIVAVDGSKLRAKTAAGEIEIGYRDLEPDSLVLFASQQKLSLPSMLGIASLLYRLDARSKAEKVLARALQQDAANKPEIDRAVAHGRGEPIDPRGYELRADGFVSAANAEAEKQATKVLSRIDTALRSKDPKARAAVVQDALALGPGAVSAVASRFQRLLDKEIETLDASPLKKQIDKLAAQRDLLDTARHAAKELIFDEVRYFYPYKPPQVEPQRYAEYVKVQAEVNRLVDGVRTVWNDERLRIKVPTSLTDSIERLEWISTVLAELGELDPLASVGIEWARALSPGASIDIHTYCRTQEEREQRAHWQQIDAYNEVLLAQIDKGEAAQFRITNAYRAMFGHRPLALDLRIRSAARAHAEEMTKLGYFSHFSPTPGRKTPGDRMLIAGYTHGTGENIALVDGPEGAHNAWCQSSGHHRNLLNANHTELGVGGSDRNWVQNFGHGVEYAQKLDPVQKPAKTK